MKNAIVYTGGDILSAARSGDRLDIQIPDELETELQELDRIAGEEEEGAEIDVEADNIFFNKLAEADRLLVEAYNLASGRHLDPDLVLVNYLEQEPGEPYVVATIVEDIMAGL